MDGALRYAILAGIVIAWLFLIAMVWRSAASWSASLSAKSMALLCLGMGLLAGTIFAGLFNASGFAWEVPTLVMFACTFISAVAAARKKSRQEVSQ